MLFSLLLFGALAAPAPDTAEQRFERLMRDILILDTHVDTPRYVVDEGYRLADEHNYYETDIPRLRRGKFGAIFFGVYAQPEDYPPQLWVPRALECIDAVHQEVAANARDLELASTASDIARIHQAGRIAVLIGLEGGHMIQDSQRILRDYYRLGVRYMTLTHFKTNHWADSSTDAAVHNGLSGLGREIVREMNRLGMMIDVSHVSDKTFFDAVEVSRAPVIFSHSSVRALCDIPRNVSDDMLRALARNGGVIGINFHAGYLDKKAYDVYMASRDQRNRDRADMLALNKGSGRQWELERAIDQRYRALLPKVSYEMIVKHIDHVVKIAGIDHVGIGSDFDGISGMVPAGLEDVSKYPKLVRALLDAGYSDGDIRKIMGENVLRVMRACEKAAGK